MHYLSAQKVEPDTPEYEATVVIIILNLNGVVLPLQRPQLYEQVLKPLRIVKECKVFALGRVQRHALKHER
jgi:hypothetical protein